MVRVESRAGKRRVGVSRQQLHQQTPRQKIHSAPSVFGFTRLTRIDAITHAATLLRRSPTNREAMRLVHLFHIHYEELAEAGVPYELLRAIERQTLVRF
jgi:hypothetical protein